MTADIAARPPQDVAPAARPKKPNPLRALPPDWRDPAAFFYACLSDTLKSPVGVVALLRMWQRDHGLTLADAKAAMHRLLTPEEVGQFEFPSQIIARLGVVVAEVVKARRERDAREEAERRFRTRTLSGPTAAAVERARAAMGDQ